jgi:5-methyltetrahydropteroyltriglutamate--homocysteine methyltransferase
MLTVATSLPPSHFNHGSAMRLSDNHIITTHVGSLPRTERLDALLISRDHGRHVDETEFVTEVDRSLSYVIDRQLESGVEIGSDGEQPRVSYMTYVPQRMSGFSGVSKRKQLMDMVRFPKYAQMYSKRIWSGAEDQPKILNCPQATGKVTYDVELRDARFELDRFKLALERATGHFPETFVTAISPGMISVVNLRADDNPFYPSDREYLFDLAHEMKKEYELIVSRGHLLQLDAPDLAMERQFMFQDRPLNEFLQRVELHVEAINIATADIPRDKIRLHVCFGNWDGPHIDDVELGPVLPLIYNAKVGALSLSCANPRHQHEYKAVKKNRPPTEMAVLPGVIDVTTNYLEHPEVVADRICQWVDAVGDRERVIASTDCGFGSFANFAFVAEDVCWAKLRMLKEGAAIATERLWS